MPHVIRKYAVFLLIAAVPVAAGFFTGRTAAGIISLSIPLSNVFFGNSPEKVLLAVRLIESASPTERIKGYYLLDGLSLFGTEEKLKRLSRESESANRLVLVMLLRNDPEAMRRAIQIIEKDETINPLIKGLQSPSPSIEQHLIY